MQKSFTRNLLFFAIFHLGFFIDSSPAAVVFVVNTSDQGSISTLERTAWHQSLPLSNSSLFGLATDPGTTSGTDLLTQTVASTIAGSNYSFVVTEGGLTSPVNFSSTITGGPNPGGSLTGFGTVNFDFERPATQNSVSSAGWGYDTGSSTPNSVSNARDVLRFDFTGSSTPVRSFAASLIDLESTTGARGFITAYDVAGQLLGIHTLDYGALTGEGEGHQIAVGTTSGSNSLGYLFFVVGDNTSGYAMGDIALGTAWLVPEPSRALLLFASLGTIVMRRRRITE